LNQTAAHPIEQIKTLLHELLGSLVDHKDDLRIDVVAGGQATVFEIHCASADRGKVIGKGGEMAKCLRYFVSSLAAKNRIRCMVEIVD